MSAPEPAALNGGALTEGAPRPEAARRWETTIARDRGRRDYLLRRALAIADAAGISLALLAAFAMTGIRSAEDILYALPVLPAWVALFGIYGGYGRDLRRISRSGLDDLPWLFHALLVGSLLSWVYFRLLPVHQLVAEELAVFGFAAIVLIPFCRWVARSAVVAALGRERMLLIGEAPVSSALVSKIRKHPEYGVDLIGVISKDGTSSSPLPALGRLDDPDLDGLVASHAVERVIVSQEQVDDGFVVNLLRTSGRRNVKVSVLPRRLLALGTSAEMDDIEGVTVFALKPLVLPRSARLAKRGVDIVGAGMGLLIFSIPMVLMALAVRLSSRGPALFRQDRLGRHGEVFQLLKFRTMVNDAEASATALQSRSEDPNWLKLDHDPRITTLGRFLRMTSLDELPQLWNVLIGQMSLVGPRPLVPQEHERAALWARARLDLAPGITGLWQVLGRTDIPFEEMLKLDYAYVTNWSLWTDVKLLIQTIPAVVRQRGAN